MRRVALALMVSACGAATSARSPASEAEAEDATDLAPAPEPDSWQALLFPSPEWAPGGPMPEGGGFQGVWHSPQFGRIALVQEGRLVRGSFERRGQFGFVRGLAKGRLLYFEFVFEGDTEASRGLFVYSRGEDGDHYLRGQWGSDETLSGGPWNAVRDRRAQPEIRPGLDAAFGGPR